jgi:tripartite-type tricarboxylate transporter receptor subunit TctC
LNYRLCASNINDTQRIIQPTQNWQHRPENALATVTVAPPHVKIITAATALAAVTLAGGALTCVQAASTGAGSAYPSRPIRFIVPGAGSGAGADLYARLIGKKLNDAWGQPVVIDNRVGANGSIGAAAVVKSQPDGYTLMLGHPNQLTVGPAIRPDIGYDPTRDFSPITMLMAAPSLWSVPGNNSTINSVAEFVAAAQKRPGEISFGTTGIGSVGHLIGQLFSQRALIKLHHVPYKGAAPAIIDLAAGRINLVSAALAAQIAFVRDGKIKGIATTGLRRARLTPNVPTLDESGFKGFDVTAWHGVLAPARVDPAIIMRLNREIVRIIGLADVQEVLLQEGGEITPTTPEAFASIIRNEYAKWQKVVKQAGVTPDQ